MTEKSKKNFEVLLEEIDSIMDSLEKGDLSLENSLQFFEKGIKNIRFCRDILKKTEQKVSVLIQKNNKEDDYELKSMDKKEKND